MSHTLLFFSLGGQEIALLVLAVLLLFGGKKIPELMRGIGRGIREFNDARSTIKDEIEHGMKDKEGNGESKGA
jgi:sec-independent protein translocase protein TatA